MIWGKKPTTWDIIHNSSSTARYERFRDSKILPEYIHGGPRTGSERRQMLFTTPPGGGAWPSFVRSCPSSKWMWTGCAQPPLLLSRCQISTLPSSGAAETRLGSMPRPWPPSVLIVHGALSVPLLLTLPLPMPSTIELFCSASASYPVSTYSAGPPFPARFRRKEHLSTVKRDVDRTKFGFRNMTKRDTSCTKMQAP